MQKCIVSELIVFFFVVVCLWQRWRLPLILISLLLLLIIIINHPLIRQPLRHPLHLRILRRLLPLLNPPQLRLILLLLLIRQQVILNGAHELLILLHGF